MDAQLPRTPTEHLCIDKNRRQIRPGDKVRISTIASLNGVYPVIRGGGGELRFWVEYWPWDEKEPIGFEEPVIGFYPSTLEVVDSP